MARHTAGNNKIDRIEQPIAGQTERRRGIHRRGSCYPKIVSRRFDLSAVAALGAAFRADRTGEAGLAVGPDCNRAAIALACRVGGYRRLADDRALRVGERSLPVQTAANLDRSAAGIARCIDLRAIGDIHRTAGDVDRAAGLALRHSGRIERSTVVDRTVGAGIEIDDAVVGRHRRRLDHAGVVDDVVFHVARCARRHHHLAAGREDRAGVGNKRGGDAAVRVFRRVRDGGGNLIAQKIIARHVDRKRAGSAQHDSSQIRLNQTFIRNPRGRQNDRSVGAGCDRAFVDDGGVRIGSRLEIIFSALEIVVAEIGCRGEQRADIDLTALAEQNTVRIDQPNAAVGQKLAFDDGGVGAGDAIDGERFVVRLVEFYRRAARNGKAVPVDERLLARLIHHRLRRARVCDRRTADHDLAARRSAAGHRRRGSKKRRADQATGRQQQSVEDCGTGSVHRLTSSDQNVIAMSVRNLVARLPLSLPGTLSSVRAPSKST